MWLNVVIGVAGLALGAAAAAAWFLARRGREQLGSANLRARAELLDQQAVALRDELNAARQDVMRTAEERETARRERAVLAERLEAQKQELAKLAEIETRFKDAFAAMSSESLKSSNEQFLGLAAQKLQPFKDLLDKHDKTLRDIEEKRAQDKGAIEQHLKSIAASHEKLGSETGRLVSALRRPETRGRWGELQLRNTVELAGMTEHCDFCEQVSVMGEEGRLRPDMVVRLPGGGEIPVDAKVAFDAYLDSLQAAEDRGAMMDRHCRHVQEHVKRLSEKKYWDQFENTPGVVVMFMPLESALVAALEVNPNLHAEAMERHVLIATPTLLVALLRAVAYGWKQEAIAANAKEIGDLGREFYKRLVKFLGDYQAVGRNLKSAVDRYNDSIGSAEARLLPSARKFEELKADSDLELPELAPVEIEVRQFNAPEITSRLMMDADAGLRNS